jgi:flavodoxin
MKTWVVYDSVHGNTEKIAQAIGAAIGADVPVVRVSEVDLSKLESVDLLIAGAPTYGGRPREPMQDWLNQIPAGALQGKHVAAFDTRIGAFWVRIFGFAAGKIARSLEQKGGKLTMPGEGFIVMGGEGPLKEGELERAANWAKEVLAAAQ